MMIDPTSFTTIMQLVIKINKDRVLFMMSHSISISSVSGLGQKTLEETNLILSGQPTMVGFLPVSWRVCHFVRITHEVISYVFWIIMQFYSLYHIYCLYHSGLIAQCKPYCYEDVDIKASELSSIGTFLQETALGFVSIFTRTLLSSLCTFCFAAVVTPRPVATGTGGHIAIANARPPSRWDAHHRSCRSRKPMRLQVFQLILLK